MARAGSDYAHRVAEAAQHSAFVLLHQGHGSATDGGQKFFFPVHRLAPPLTAVQKATQAPPSMTMAIGKHGADLPGHNGVVGQQGLEALVEVGA